MSSEQSLVSARATVMTYDDVNKKWVPSGSSSGLSKVHIYQHPVNNTFRVVGWKIHDHEVVINCAILKGLKYIQATPTFHQWRDNRQVYGLNFNTKEEAELFALAMLRTLSILSQSIAQNHRTSSHHVQPLYQTIGHSGVSLDDYAEYKGRVNNDTIDKKSSPQDYVQCSGSTVNHGSHPTTPGSIPSPGISGHHRTSSAPPISLTPTGSIHSSTSPCAPPPPPPPPPASTDLCGLVTLPRQTAKANPSPMTLASALATAKLRKTPEKLQNDSVNNDSRIVPAIGGMASIMDEMTRTLARRRAQAENSTDPDGSSSAGSEGGKTWDKQGTGNGLSPNKNSGLESPQTLHKLKVEGSGDGDKLHLIDAFDMEKMKQDIVTEIKKEVNKMKQDIIDVIRSELNRR